MNKRGQGRVGARAARLAVAIGVSAGSAGAQPFEGHGYIRFEVATSQAGPWSRSLSVQPGTHVFMRALNGWLSPAPVFGWASTVLEEVRFKGADPSDRFEVLERPPGRSGDRTNFDISVASGYTLWKRQVIVSRWEVYSSTFGVTLDNAVKPTAQGRLVTGQSVLLPPIVRWYGQWPDLSNPTVGWYFRFQAGSPGLAGPRPIRITADWYRSATPPPLGNHFVVYINEAGSNTKFTTDAVLEDAVVTIVPGPASAAVLLGLLALRARRRAEASPTPPRPSPEGDGVGAMAR